MTLPPNPDLSRLKDEAKQLLRAAHAGDAPALQRFAAALPALHGRRPAAAEALRLHDAQSVVAREHGLPSWTELKRRVEWQRADLRARKARWAGWAYDGNARDRRRALEAWRAEPALLAGDPWLACAVGDEETIAAALNRDPEWANRPGGPKAMPPLVALTHSRLIGEDEREPAFLAAARRLLAHGADPNVRWTDPRYPDWPLSALYGAAGRNHDPAMTALLLEAGADPNDNESLYHSVESRDLRCTELLLAAGARVAGTNALARALDFDDIEALRLLLRHDTETPSGHLIHHAILRGRSAAHVEALLAAGADPRATAHDGVSVWQWAAQHGRGDITALLGARGADEAVPAIEERFVAACARGDEAEARTLLADAPDLIARLTPDQRETLPRLAALGEHAAVRLMLALGWPIETKTGWDATALNHAVFRGDAGMARLLLAAGADWRTPHGFGDNVLGTLSFASQSDEIEESAPRDFAGCARALAEAGIPRAEFDGRTFSPEVGEALAGIRTGAAL